MIVARNTRATGYAFVAFKSFHKDDLLANVKRLASIQCEGSAIQPTDAHGGADNDAGAHQDDGLLTIFKEHGAAHGVGIELKPLVYAKGRLGLRSRAGLVDLRLQGAVFFDQRGDHPFYFRF